MQAATKGDDPPSIEAEALLAKVRDIVFELHPHMRDRVHVTLDSALDRDLGLDSLARVELLVRIERSFGTSLSEETLASVDTPRDLLRALAAGNGVARSAVVVDVDTAEPVAIPAPTEARTLVEALDWHVRRNPERTHVHLYDESGGIRDIHYRDLL
ncbi:MAG: acyl carrier protein, partial [Gammaproteobacteria bacterium]|nr:acyl carrier protein [Gammaproteobacteria bacterium]